MATQALDSKYSVGMPWSAHTRKQSDKFSTERADIGSAYLADAFRIIR